jgi:AmpD protein
MTSDATWSGGWWQGAVRRKSPNYDARDPGNRIELVVLHHISLPAGQFGGENVQDFFENRLDPTATPEFAPLADVRVSAHFFSRRDGAVLQFVSCDDRAWHAGVSAWRGRPVCNNFSVGIEIEGDSVHSFTEAQYCKINDLLGALKRAYPIAAVTTHSEIAAGRKVDPGPTFDWSRISLRWDV